MREVTKNSLRIGFIIASYIPLLFRLWFYEYESVWLVVIKMSADFATISFFWLILSGFPQGILQSIFPTQFSTKFHKWLAPFASSLIFIHIIGNTVRLGEWKLLIPFFHGYSALISLGALAMILLLIVVLTSYTLRYRRDSWQIWNLFHYLNYLLFTLIIFHSFVSLDLSTPTGLYYLLIYTIGIIAIAFKLLFDLKFLSIRVKILGKQKLADDTYNLVLQMPKQAIRTWSPGQHLMLGISRFGDNHPYSISKLNLEESTVEVTFKVFGDFTENLAKKRKGAWVYVYGAFGEFGQNVQKERGPVVFIAGGVGITPFRAMIHEMLASKMERPIYLFHGCKEKDDFLFLEEFFALARKHKNFHYVCVCEVGPFPDHMERGYVTKETLMKYLGSFSGKSFYIIGPPVMMNVLSEMLETSGVSKERIHVESF